MKDRQIDGSQSSDDLRREALSVNRNASFDSDAMRPSDAVIETLPSFYLSLIDPVCDSYSLTLNGHSILLRGRSWKLIENRESHCDHIVLFRK